MSDSETNSELPSKAKKLKLSLRYRTELDIHPVMTKSGFVEMYDGTRIEGLPFGGFWSALLDMAGLNT